MVFALFAMQMAVWAQEASGYCGDPNVNEGKDVTWSVVDGTLTISGVGAMADYDWAGPWSAFNKVVVTEGVTSIGRCAFNFCSGFTDITLPNSLVSIGQSAFSFCSGLSSVLVPNSVTTIGDGAFSFCGGLTHVKLPDGITAIGDDMFCYSSNLTTITIPATVTHIGQSAFLQSALAEVICVNPIPPTLDADAFFGIPDDATLRVPDVEAYKASDWAQYFSKIEQIDPTAILGVKADKDAPATIYDLSGRRVTEPIKGRIYIVNGKAVVWR